MINMERYHKSSERFATLINPCLSGGAQGKDADLYVEGRWMLFGSDRSLLEQRIPMLVHSVITAMKIPWITFHRRFSG